MNSTGQNMNLIKTHKITGNQKELVSICCTDEVTTMPRRLSGRGRSQWTKTINTLICKGLVEQVSWNTIRLTDDGGLVQNELGTEYVEMIRGLFPEWKRS